MRIPSAALRLVNQRTVSLVQTQTRNARIVNARFFQSRVEPRIVDKYKEKLEKKIKSEGVSSYDELRSAYAEKIAAVRKASAASPEVEAVISKLSPAEEALSTPPASSPFQQTPPPVPTPVSPTAAAAHKVSGKPPGLKTLADYVDVDKLLTHTNPQEIEYIWRARFLPVPSSLCASIPASTWSRMYTLARQHPMFILPLPREGQGAEMHLMQWAFPGEDTATLMFTSLAEYKLRGEFAQPHTTLTHHLELERSRGVVLAQGLVVEDRGVSVADAQLLMMTVQKFYGAIENEDGGKRRRMLEMFSRGEEGFSVQELMDEVEKAV